jgi:hypothetical protein
MSARRPKKVRRQGNIGMSGLPWRNPVWVGCTKHRPIIGTPWAQVRAGTNQGNKVAKYHENMTDDDIEAIEMSFAEPEDLIYERTCVRYYYARSSGGAIIGASNGQDTAFVLIQRHQTGDVHGYPETRDRLISLMRKRNTEQLARFLQRFPP